MSACDDSIAQWHNGRTLGYEPWTVGFQESWLPTSHVHLDNLMRCAQLPFSKALTLFSDARACARDTQQSAACSCNTY
jgi:hypothetical protein